MTVAQVSLINHFTKKLIAMNVSIIEQIRIAFKGSNRLAACVGTVFGAFIPLATFLVAHNQHPLNTDTVVTFYSYVNIFTAIVLGGLTYSAITVYQWAMAVTKMKPKAVGFVVLIETVMVVSKEPYLAYAALALLVTINGIATGTVLALDAKKPVERTQAPRKRVQAPKTSLRSVKAA